MNNLSTSTAVTVTGYNNTNVTGKFRRQQHHRRRHRQRYQLGPRLRLKSQFNSLMTQIDKLAGDSGYNGINLLNGDKLNLSFNENNSSNISVQMSRLQRQQVCH